MKYDTVTACHTRKDTRLVLRYVNKLRAELGLSPLHRLAKGYTGNPKGCSIAASLNTKYTKASVSTLEISVHRFSRLSNNMAGRAVQTLTVKPPEYVISWIEKFDSGVLEGLTKVVETKLTTKK